jgi:hypothetical protein
MLKVFKRLQSKGSDELEKKRRPKIGALKRKYRNVDTATLDLLDAEIAEQFYSSVDRKFQQ